MWAGAEDDLADKATLYTSTELGDYARALIERLDQDGPGPDPDERTQVNALILQRRHNGSGGKLTADLDAVLFDAVATALDAAATPLTADDTRGAPERQADALAEICRFVLTHGSSVLPACGGERPHLNVIVGLEDLENRARAATLDFGGRLSPAQLRLLACDARVVPVVMNGAGQPLDVGRASRTIPDGLRRAVAARDRGCAHPGCGRNPSWCEVHHIRAWEDHGTTEIGNLVMLCRFHHRLMHKVGWIVRIRDGLPEFVPPKWIDLEQRPRRKPSLRTISPGATSKRTSPPSV